jgi:3-methyladenine DNA glycosylase AlkD
MSGAHAAPGTANEEQHMNVSEALERLKALGSEKDAAGQQRVGIRPGTTVYGVSVYAVRALGKEIGTDHTLAEALWASGVHEARILAGIVADPAQMTAADLDRWAESFDSWDVVDQTCSNLFDQTPFAYQKAVAWSARPEAFVKRAGFVMMAALAVHDKRADDAAFEAFLPIIAREATDERNFVKKAVNWALRQIGKRNAALNAKAIQVARAIQQVDSKAARWIASDALRELTSEKVQARLKGKP